GSPWPRSRLATGRRSWERSSRRAARNMWRAWGESPPQLRRVRSRGAVGNRLWQREKPEAFRLLGERLREKYPELRLVERAELVVAAGIFPLVDGPKVIDRYMI